MLWGVAERREEMRAADADRQFVVQRLQQALNEGRLGLGEFDERAKEAYAARTYGDLDRLLGDLPTVVAGPQAQWAPLVPSPPPSPSVHLSAVPAAPAGPPARGRAPWLTAIWNAWLIAVSINVVIWVLVSISAGELVYFWPMWVAGPWGTVLVLTTFSGIGRNSYQRHQEREARRQQRRAQRYCG